MTQQQLGDQLGRTRQWVADVEHFRRMESWPVGMTTRIAALLDLDPRVLLIAAGVPEKDWPHISNTSSIDGRLHTVDLTGLTDRQIKLIYDLVAEFRRRNDPRNHF